MSELSFRKDSVKGLQNFGCQFLSGYTMIRLFYLVIDERFLINLINTLLLKEQESMSICTVIQQRANENNVVGKMSDGLVITDNALILAPLSREHTSFTSHALSLCVRHRILSRLFCLLFINSTQTECNQTRTNITSKQSLENKIVHKILQAPEQFLYLWHSGE